MSENKSSFSRLGSHFKMAARDAREGVTLLTTRFATSTEKGWSAFGHMNMVTAVLRGIEFAGKSAAQNTGATWALCSCLIAFSTAAIAYSVGGRRAREGRELVAEVMREYNEKNPPASTPAP